MLGILESWIWELWGFGVFGVLSLGIFEFWNFGLGSFWSIGVLSLGILGSWIWDTLGVLESWGFEVYNKPCLNHKP